MMDVDSVGQIEFMMTLSNFLFFDLNSLCIISVECILRWSKLYKVEFLLVAGVYSR